MSDNKKFRIQNGVDVTGELSINDVVVIDANGKVVPEAISEAISGSTSSDIAALQAQVSAILGTSPETLDTLQEIVASFQDADSNIVTTVSTNTTAIADMQPQVSTNTAAIAAANARTSGISTSSGSSNIQMSAEVDMDGNKVTNMGEPTDGSDAATKDYVDVKSQLAVTTGATDKAELLAAIAAETNRATVVESTLQTNIDSLSDDKDSDIAQEITNRTTADALLQAQIDAEESARTIQDASLDSKITSEATRAVAAESGLQQSINDITSGTSEFTGDLIPNQDNVHSLGSETKMWKDVYIGPGSLYINGQKVIEDNSGTITVNADPGQNLSLNTSGGGAIDLNSGAESVQIRSDLVISSSKTISTTGGAPTKFGGDVDMQGNTLGNVAEPVNDNDAVTKAWFESYVATPHTGSKTFVDDVVIQGNLTVSGSTITVNSETMSVADNMVDLNSNMTSGTPTENAGIRVMRGDQSPKTFLWNEANDQWTAEGPLKADSFVGDGSGLSGMYGDADVTALVDSDYIQSRQSSSNSLSMGDGEIATFGDSNDLSIYHDGTNSYISDQGTGNLNIQTNGVGVVIADTSASDLAVFNAGNGQVSLYNSGSQKLATTSTGIDITGSVEADGGNFTGQVQFNGTAGIQLDDGAQAHTWTLDDNFTSRLNIGTASSSATWKIGSNNNDYLTVSPSGIDVTGTVTADGGTFDGELLVTGGGSGTILVNDEDSSLCPTMTFTRNGAGTTTNDFIKFKNSGGEVAAINSFGGAYFLTNVGIGTPSPASKLHAYTASGNNIIRSESGDNYAAFQTLASGTNSGYIFFNNASGETGRITSANGGTMVFSNKGTQERMRIDSLGKVGIGTSSPLTILEIEDLQSQLTIDSTASSFSRVVHQHNGTSMWTTGTRSASDYHIYRESGSGNVIIDQANVGIGTSAPIHRLSVDSSNRLWNVNDDGPTNYVTTSATNTSGSVVFHRQVADRFHFGRAVDGTDDKVIIDSAGNVGIGVTNSQGYGKVAIQGGGIGDSNSNLALLTDGAAQGELAGLSLYGTFENTVGDNAPRRTADIAAGFEGGNWGTEYLAFHVGRGGSANDGRLLTTERVRIDGSGNLLVGTTSSNFAVAGSQLGVGGNNYMTRSGANPLLLNRLSSDGAILSLAKNGTTVGSIGTYVNLPYIGKSDVNLLFDPAGPHVIPRGTNGGARDGAINLGELSNRFKDLYLSGTLNGISTTKSASGNRWGILPEVEGNGVMEIGRYIDFHSTDADTSDYGARLDFDGTNLISTAPIRASGGVRLGGQGAANTLDDYEEGTFTPVITGTTGTPTVTYYTQDGIYTKIGRTVYYRVGLRVKTISGGSGILRVTGLPFTAKSYPAYTNPFGMANNGNLTVSQSGPIVLFVEGNVSSLQGRYTNTNADNPLPLGLIQAGSYMLVEGFYEVA